MQPSCNMNPMDEAALQLRPVFPRAPAFSSLEENHQKGVGKALRGVLQPASAMPGDCTLAA